MGRVKTFSNGGSLLPGDLNSIEDDYEFGFSTYKTILREAGYLNSGLAALTRVFIGGGQVTDTGTDVKGFSCIYIDPADLTANTRTNKFRVRASLFTNATAPAINFTIGLYPVTAVAGAANQLSATVGAAVAGSTIAFNAPAASTQFQNNSGDFTAPAAGYYALGVVNSGGGSAGMSVTFDVMLQARQV